MFEKIYDELLDDLNLFYKRNINLDDSEESKIEDLLYLLEDYCKYLKDELNTEKPEIDVDKIIEEQKLSQI